MQNMAKRTQFIHFIIFFINVRSALFCLWLAVISSFWKEISWKLIWLVAVTGYFAHNDTSVLSRRKHWTWTHNGSCAFIRNLVTIHSRQIGGHCFSSDWSSFWMFSSQIFRSMKCDFFLCSPNSFYSKEFRNCLILLQVDWMTLQFRFQE